MKLKKSHKRFITASILATIFWIIFFYLPPVALSVTLIGVLIAILFQEWTTLFQANKFLFWIITPIYPVLPFILLIYMNHSSAYRTLLYFLFFIVFSFDTSAYIVGTMFGKHKVLPSISPNKTIEGCVGGFFGALIAFYFAIWEANIHTTHLALILFTLITCCIAFLGDIFESYLKRRAKIKDSGNSLPGHGGFLDRFDAVMMVAYFFFVFKDIIIRIFPT